MGEWLGIAERPSSIQGSYTLTDDMGDTFALAQGSTGTPRPLSSGIALDTHMWATVCPQCLPGKQQMIMKMDRCKAMHMGKRQPYTTCGIMLSELTTIHQEWELGILSVGQCQNNTAVTQVHFLCICLNKMACSLGTLESWTHHLLFVLSATILSCAKETTQNLVKSQSTVTHMGWGEAANTAVSGITECARSERNRVLPRQVPPHAVPREGLQNPEPSSFPGICSCLGRP